MVEIPMSVMNVIVGGSIHQPQLIQDDSDAFRFGKLHLSVHRSEPRLWRTDLQFLGVSFMSLPMAETPVRAFTVMALNEARKKFLLGHPALKTPKLPRETFVYIFDSDQEASYFVIAKSMSFEPYEKLVEFPVPILVPPPDDHVH